MATKTQNLSLETRGTLTQIDRRYGYTPYQSKVDGVSVDRGTTVTVIGHGEIVFEAGVAVDQHVQVRFEGMGFTAWILASQIKPVSMTGREITRMMRLNRVTIRDIADLMNITLVRVRQVRRRGILESEGYGFSWDWVEQIAEAGELGRFSEHRGAAGPRALAA